EWGLRAEDERGNRPAGLLFVLVRHGRRRVVVRLPLGVEPFLEGVDTLPQGEHQAGKTMAEKNENDHRDDDQFRLANPEHSKKRGHSIALALKGEKRGHL